MGTISTRSDYLRFAHDLRVRFGNRVHSSHHGGCGVPAGHWLTQRSAGGFDRASLQVIGTPEWTLGNDEAEQVIRMSKLCINVSVCMRSM